MTRGWVTFFSFPHPPFFVEVLMSFWSCSLWAFSSLVSSPPVLQLGKVGLNFLLALTCLCLHQYQCGTLNTQVWYHLNTGVVPHEIQVWYHFKYRCGTTLNTSVVPHRIKVWYVIKYRCGTSLNTCMVPH